MFPDVCCLGCLHCMNIMYNDYFTNREKTQKLARMKLKFNFEKRVHVERKWTIVTEEQKN